MIHEESSSILDMWKGDVSECFVLPFQDAIPRASPYDFSDNPASSFDLHTTSVRSGFRPFIMLIR